MRKKENREYARDRREERKDEKREKILNTAFRVFVERKIEAVSMGEIAEAAGIGRATLFRYYPNKLELVIAVVPRYGRII